MKLKSLSDVKLRMNSTDRMQRVQFKSFQRPVQSFIMANDRMPKQIPSAME